MRVLWISRYKGNLNGYRPEGEILIDLKKAGVDIDFMGYGDADYLQRIRAHDIPIIDYRAPTKKFSLPAIQAIRKQLLAGQYDIVQAFQGPVIAAMSMAAMGLPVKTVGYRGQTGNIYRYDPASYLTMLHPRLDAIVCVAQAVEHDLRRHLWGKVHPRTTTIYKGHDVAWYRRQPVDLTERLSIPRDAFVVGFAANVRPRKGLAVLIECTKYLPIDASIYFVLMGTGTDSTKVAVKTGSSWFNDRFLGLGYRRDVIELISSCNATVLPTTKREGLSRSIIESMALEVPVIASDTGGNAELVEHEVAGLVVPPGEPKALAEAIMRLYHDPNWAAELGKQARQRIAEHFNHQQTVSQYLAFYQGLISVSR